MTMYNCQDKCLVGLHVSAQVVLQGVETLQKNFNKLQLDDWID